MFRKILIANRGEIALRVIRACKELGVPTVLACSEPDLDSLPAQLADEKLCIGPASADRSYLNTPNIVSACLTRDADAIHPGYGFLAESAYLAEICDHYGIAFIGPPAQAIENFSDKMVARRMMKQAGVPVIPGTDDPMNSLDEARDAAASLGYPVMIKAAAGGGGRGIRLARHSAELAQEFPVAQVEALTNFGDGSLYLESYIPKARHIEVQLMADRHGTGIWLGERECSLQRRHQKILEEAPSPALDDQTRAALGEMAIGAALALGFYNVGTMEFLLSSDGRLLFLEMNTRIQVEHPVSETVTGVDLVKWQIRLAAGEPLSLRQEDVVLRGHAIECRVTAEDAEKGFSPVTGRVSHYLPPGGPGVRVDSHLMSGWEVAPYYDSLLAKVIAWGADRHEAIMRIRRALDECRIEGICTTLPYLRNLVGSVEFESGNFSTEFVEEELQIQRRAVLA